MRKLAWLTLLLLLLVVSSPALADTTIPIYPLNSEYSIAASATHLTGNEYMFTYAVTNLQGLSGGSGLDGFSLVLPTGASVVSVSAPLLPSGGTGSDTVGWKFSLDGNKAGWWGWDYTSVYPSTKPALFSIVLDHVNVGLAQAVATTYWNGLVPPVGDTSYGIYPWGSYKAYEASATGPSAVPVPGAVWLLGSGLAGLFGLRRKLAA